MADEPTTAMMRPTISAGWAGTMISAIQNDGAAVASFATRSGLALIAGGLPVIIDGQVAGGIGVAGAMTGAEDRAIAEAAVGAVAR